MTNINLTTERHIRSLSKNSACIKALDGTKEPVKLVINQEQAQLVRRIYGMFLKGHSPYQIAKTLTDEGVPTPAGKKKWSYTTIRRVLSNETYMGDKLLQKTYSIDFLSKDRLKNHGEVPQYYVEGDHEYPTK
ncbi:MAG: recombinase family protein [Blautia sp.]|nr:recombinase family protein [Blautia sp.]